MCKEQPPFNKVIIFKLLYFDFQLSTLTGIQNPVIENAEGIDYLNFTPKPIELDAGGIISIYLYIYYFYSSSNLTILFG